MEKKANVISSVADFLRRNGTRLMIAGFAIAAISLVAIIVWEKTGNMAIPIPRNALFPIGLSGFIIYIFGRIGLALKQKAKKSEQTLDVTIEQK